MQGVLAEMALRLAVTLFTRREPQHQQHMVVVPLPLISQSPLLPKCTREGHTHPHAHSRARHIEQHARAHRPRTYMDMLRA